MKKGKREGGNELLRLLSLWIKLSSGNQNEGKGMEKKKKIRNIGHPIIPLEWKFLFNIY